MWEGYTRKVDKGFQIDYFKLSYRRKMIGTLWLTLIVPFLYYLLRYIGLDLTYTLIILLICLVGHLTQIFYNYYMWNNYERNTK